MDGTADRLVGYLSQAGGELAERSTPAVWTAGVVTPLPLPDGFRSGKVEMIGGRRLIGSTGPSGYETPNRVEWRC